MRRDRLVWLLAGMSIACAVLIGLYLRGPSGFPICLLHRLTGLDCPGCGMTRAVHSTLHGKIAEAFRFNPLGMLALPLTAGWLLLRIPHWLRGEPPPEYLRIGWHVACGLFALVVCYGILRNVPHWPFTLLGTP